MKKYLSFLFLLFLLFGCQEKLPEERYFEIHPMYKGYATGIKIEEDKAYIDDLPPKSFSSLYFQDRISPH